ncbi:MAG: carbohydrate binding domain-containing protein, partial [Oscillospiraceae bacterium]|nr:carbohydrate binding domain-containing protein [Oscillospiraceae bacterium]
MKRMQTKGKKLLSLTLGFVTAISTAALFPVLPASAAKLLYADFETTNDSFTGRGGAEVQWTSDQHNTTNCALFVSGRTASWNGASRDVSSLMSAGQTYSVSAAVYQATGEAVEMKLSMQCSVGGTTKYVDIAVASVESEAWCKLENASFEVPDGATDMSIYVETTESLCDFYVDSVTVNGSPATIKKGDANGDLSVDVADAVYLAKYLSCQEETVEAGADFDENQVINAVDLSLLKNYILFPPAKPQTEIVGDWDNYQEKATGNDLKTLQGSLLRLGNTYRIREKIAKAQRGEKVSIGYIGGSITEGGSSTSADKSF